LLYLLRMKLPLFAAFASLSLGATSCLGVGPNTCNATLFTPVQRATGPKTGAVNQPAVYTLVYATTSGCGTLGTPGEQVDNTTRTVMLNVNYTGCACATPGATAQTTYTFQPTQVGTYYLRFVGDGKYLVDTLVVQ
jgi:hypothetical protein